MAEQTSAERIQQADRAADQAAVEELLADMRSRGHLLIPEYIDRLRAALGSIADAKPNICRACQRNDHVCTRLGVGGCECRCNGKFATRLKQEAREALDG